MLLQFFRKLPMQLLRPALKFSVTTHPLALPGEMMTRFEAINQNEKIIQLESVGWISPEKVYEAFCAWPVTLAQGEQQVLQLPQAKVEKLLERIKYFAARTTDGKIYRKKLTREMISSLKIKSHFCQMPINSHKNPH